MQPEPQRSPPAQLVAWGSAQDGQLGALTTDVATPRPLGGFPPGPPDCFTAGLWTSVVVSDGAIFASRAPDRDIALAPARLPSLPRDVPPAAVAVGRDFVLLLSPVGKLFSLGAGAYGQLGLGDHITSIAVPTEIDALTAVKVVAIAAAEFHWLALDSAGNVFACGNNKSAQLGLAHTSSVSVPTRVSALWPHPVVAIATGDGHSAVLSATGHVFCFGSNKHGQLGTASRLQVASLTPTLVPVPQPRVTQDPMDVDSAGASAEFTDPASDGEPVCVYVDVDCGSAHTVALRSDGALVCWGQGDNGQLGTRTTRSLYEPMALSTSTEVPFVAVSAGERHSAAVTADGVAYFWGDGSSGQIGDNDMSDKYVPIALAPPRLQGVHIPLRYVRVVCGGFHNLALIASHETPVYDAARLYQSRIPRCVVDNMLQPKAGYARFGSAHVLLRTFVQSTEKPFSGGKVDYISAETAHVKFLRTFGDEGERVLRHAAAKIRHDAQIAFGLVQDNGKIGACSDDEMSDERSLVTPRGSFAKDENSFRPHVANSPECGYLFFIALMNPIYGVKQYVPELSELAAILQRCEEGAREAFLQLISYCEETVLLNRILRPLQAVLTDELRGFRRITRNAIFATKMLALCYHGVWRASRRTKVRGLAISRKEFYNETVSEMVNLAEDYERWVQGNSVRSENEAADVGQPTTVASQDLAELPPLPTGGRDEPGTPFAFCSYSFLLTESAKFKILEFESQSTMSRESMRSVLSFGAMQMPVGRLSHIRLAPEQMAHLQYLMLHVRRNNIVSDAYMQVAELAENHQRELRKPLKVIFDGEEGVDEGGVRKEFYQVLLEHILSPDYCMFEYDEETRFHWFRKDFLEPEMSWTLIGIMFGLAAFNSILLDVQFPPVVYRKLMVALQNSGPGGIPREDGVQYKADLNDVKETFPSIGNSLQILADYEGEDLEGVFCLNFEISYRGLFDKEETVELVPNGAQRPVTLQNRDEFIALYIDYLIKTSIERAFTPFATGFAFMLDGPFVNKLTADELETLVIGEKELDFSGLRQAARYEGYSERSAVIVNLWQVLGEFDDESKRLFLSFVTGTDRAPIGGLEKLVLVIQRAEGDSNRLPTSHTCFNVLLLPEYATRAKLRDRLLTAIQNSKGFGLQ